MELRRGEAIHAAASKLGLASGAAAALVRMYARCGGAAVRAYEEVPASPPERWNAAISSLFRSGVCDSARQLFDKMPCKNAVTWSALISGYAQNQRPVDALLVFKQMISETTCPGFLPAQTLSSAISAGKDLRDLNCIAQIHCYAFKISCYVCNDCFVGSNLVDAYGKCSMLELAQRMFEEMLYKTVVSWSSLMASFIREGKSLMAMGLFRDIIKTRAIVPNEFILATVLSACAHLKDLAAGKELHAYMLRMRTREPLEDIFVMSALIDMYCKCQNLDRAFSLFWKESNRKKITPLWNTMITGYVGQGRVSDAWRMIRAMSLEVQPNAVTLAIILPLCAAGGKLLRLGREAHCYSIRRALDLELLVGNSLLDMYCKCGGIASARKVFELMGEKNRISWTTLIDGYGMHGRASEAIRIFRQMAVESTAKPDQITFVALISACAHGGLVEEGLNLFKELKESHGLALTEEVNGAMVDLLARAGRLDEAREFLSVAPSGMGKNALGALLSGCRIHGEVNGAESTTRELVALEPDMSGFSALLSNIYAEKGMMAQAAEVRVAMTESNLLKKRGCSWVETRNKC